MDASDDSVIDHPGFLARSMVNEVTTKCTEEHIYARERRGAMVCFVVDSTTECETNDERVIAVKENQPWH
eukprot:5938760-Lingulodinium_polyedra.AAC.1